jgi:hypothetical protein
MKEPAWREHFKHPQALHDGYGLLKVKIPSYLRRWMVVHGNKHPDLMALDILEAAMLMYFQSMRTPAGGKYKHDFLNDLSCGKYVNGNEAEICESLIVEPSDDFVCVSNGIYGYFFFCREPTIREEGLFMTWMAGEWTPKKRKIDGRVIRVEKGEWPIHPRLIPGHPLGKDLEF